MIAIILMIMKLKKNIMIDKDLRNIIEENLIRRNNSIQIIHYIMIRNKLIIVQSKLILHLNHYYAFILNRINYKINKYKFQEYITLLMRKLMTIMNNIKIIIEKFILKQNKRLKKELKIMERLN